MIWDAIVIGSIATGFMDLIALLRKHLLGIPSLDYRLVGRWLARLPTGRIFHQSIGQVPPVRGEAALGWAAHYLIGMTFAAIYLALSPERSMSAALVFGTATVAAPFLILQPALGLGLLARKAPSPWTARLRSVTTHAIFGIGLWIGATLW